MGIQMRRLSASGELYQYANERLGEFVRRVVPPVFGGVIALDRRGCK